MEKRLLELRKKHKYTQESLAMQINISKTAISKWESGSQQPSLVYIKALSELYGVTIDYIITGKKSVVKKKRVTKTKKVDKIPEVMFREPTYMKWTNGKTDQALVGKRTKVWNWIMFSMIIIYSLGMFLTMYISANILKGKALLEYTDYDFVVPIIWIILPFTIWPLYRWRSNMTRDNNYLHQDEGIKEPGDREMFSLYYHHRDNDNLFKKWPNWMFIQLLIVLPIFIVLNIHDIDTFNGFRKVNGSFTIVIGISIYSTFMFMFNKRYLCKMTAPMFITKARNIKHARFIIKITENLLIVPIYGYDDIVLKNLMIPFICVNEVKKFKTRYEDGIEVTLYDGTKYKIKTRQHSDQCVYLIEQLMYRSDIYKK